ncbi:hypothetical protein [Terrabacter sp. 2YAF2]|uniref:hypothetical protein n=1 Tax=Terrabacter sp. 2YAF2 TaxID=3233026 RepID=UPI003F9C41A9
MNAWARIGHRIPQDPQYRVVAIAKAIAEHSRAFVSALQSLRYDAERALGRRIRGTASDDVQVLADLVELGMASNRARDFAVDASREGLWLWDWDSETYQGHRRMVDPTLPERASATRTAAPDWLSTYDAGVRHCRLMASALQEEIEQFHRLMEAGSTISVAREAKAQEHFNLVATLAAIVIGLPSLVLAAYGAGDRMNVQKLMWTLPLIGCAFVSLLVAVLLPGDSWSGRAKRGGLSFAAVIASLGMLAFAAWAINNR